jgi:hypothetical protein
MQRKTAREATAIHEAAHVVGAIRLEVGIGRHGASIEPSEDYSGWAHIQKGFAGRPDVSSLTPTMRVRMENRVIATLCGEAAQRRYNPRSVRSYHGQSDRNRAVDLLSYLTGSNTTLGKHIDYLAARADDFVSNPINWAAIRAVAKGLLKHGSLSNAELRRIVCDSAEKDFQARLKKSAQRRNRIVENGDNPS